MNVLIADHIHELLITGLQQLGYRVSYQPHITRDELIACIADADGLVIRTKTTVDAEVLSHAGKLKFIARAGAGTDNIDESFCIRQNITLMNAGEANADAVGEQTVGMLLALLANIVKADKEVRTMHWDRQGNTGVELKGKTVGIIGYGNTGSAVATKLAGFGVNICVYDKYKQGFGTSTIQEVTLSELQRKSAIITLHVPLTAETRYMVNSSFIDAVSSPFYLLNLARGAVIHTKDVVAALDSGKIIGAALDVLENEKPETFGPDELCWFDSLIRRNNVILTPHIGGWTRESYEKIAKVLLRKIKELPHS
ncbi:MAG: NAD(P)-dependent oxidoreductase [Bacteroidota bacterium]